MARCRKKKGWILLPPYKYAIPLKNGKWTVYEGGWSGSGEDCIAGLTAVRDNDNKPVRFDSLNEVKLKYGTRL